MTRLITFTFTFAIACTLTAYAAPQTDTTFTYQGELNENGSPVTDVCDFVFRLFGAASGGSQIGGAIAESNVNVSEGRFSAELDFGANTLDNSGRWLRIEVRCPAGAGGYTILNPRQPITRSPYSIQTRGIFVAGNKNVGIGTNSPLDELHVAGDIATLRLQDDEDPFSFAKIEDTSPNAMRISKTADNGGALIDINPRSLDGISSALVRFFRNTDTDGSKQVVFLRGNNSSSPSASIGVDGTNSYFQAHGGNVGIGVTNPLGGKLQVASPAGGPISAIDASSDNSVFPTIFAQNNEIGGPVLWAVGNSDVGLNSGGVIVVGDPNDNNIGIDGNEIMARDGGAPAPLHLNIQGGEVRMGSAAIHPAFAYGHISTTGNIVSSSSNVNGVTVHGPNEFRIGFAGGLNGSEIVVLTPVSATDNVSASVFGDQLRVLCYDVANHNHDSRVGFHFVVYRP